MAMRIIHLIAAAAFGLGFQAAAAADGGEAAWKAEIADTNAAYATDKLAVLKIDDAIYLRDGETAWLDRTGAAHGKVAWRLSPADTALVTVKYTASLARFQRSGETMTFDPAQGATMALGGGIDIKAQLTQIAPGEIGLRVFAYNQQNPAAAAFEGVRYFPYSPDYVVEAPFISEKPAPTDFQTSRGTWKRFWRVGRAEFTMKGVAVSLPLYSGDMFGTGGLTAFFSDETTGKTTYGVGRYLDVENLTFPPETVTIDFNYAYNPMCARTPHYNCPYAQDALPLAIEAGEETPPEH